MRSQLNAVIEELNYLKAQGVGAVYLADGTLERLREALLPEGSVGRFSANQPLEPLAATEISATQRRDAGGLSPSREASHLTNTFKADPIMYSKTSSLNKPIPAPEEFALPEGSKEERMSWLRERVLSCPVCREHVRPGKKIVFGVGAIDADIFFCGEAPGADEEVKGEPFVGPAGQILTRIIEAMGLKREAVYIGNIMKWRPETPDFIGNRPPTQDEMGFCLPYLKAQLDIIRPKVIVALGATAVSGLLGRDPDRKMGQIRGKWQGFQETPLMVTYHPSYILRNGSNKVKRIVWEDMLAVMERLKMPISQKQRSFFT